jgi:hypothetical protein
VAIRDASDFNGNFCQIVMPEAPHRASRTLPIWRWPNNYLVDTKFQAIAAGFDSSSHFLAAKLRPVHLRVFDPYRRLVVPRRKLRAGLLHPLRIPNGAANFPTSLSCYPRMRPPSARTPH